MVAQKIELQAIIDIAVAAGEKILDIYENSDFEKIHARCPVMISQENVQDWFNGGIEDAHTLVNASTAHVLEFHPVSLAVGKVANDDPSLIEEQALPVKDTRVSSQGQLL